MHDLNTSVEYWPRELQGKFKYRTINQEVWGQGVASELGGQLGACMLWGCVGTLVQQELTGSPGSPLQWGSASGEMTRRFSSREHRAHLIQGCFQIPERMGGGTASPFSGAWLSLLSPPGG